MPDTPAADRPATPTVTRTAELAAPIDEVRAALADPELLGAWLGPWTPTGDGTATVRTDDGVVRRVRLLPSTSNDRVRWRWWPEDDRGAISDVTIELTPTATGTVLTLTETVCSTDGRAAPALDGLGWAIALLALEVAVALRTVVRV